MSADATARSYCVAIVGASPKPERHSHLAVLKYRAAGWTVWPINPTATAVADIPAFRSLRELPGSPDIVCMYVNPTIGLDQLDDIVAVGPKQLWLNPGADGEPLASAARARGLRVIEACTLVVLGYGNPLEVIDRL
jgi:predicted CoA-binding protein